MIEIALALGLVAIAVSSAALIFPVGLRAQQVARFQMYACTKAIEISHLQVQQGHSLWRQQVEGELVGQCPITSNRTDIEDIVIDASSLDAISTMLPLPREIAQRLDSDDDEIARLIGEGASLYYAVPNAAGSGEWNGWRDTDYALPAEAQLLLFAIVGPSQQDAYVNHPCIGWPYYLWYPHPPMGWERDNWAIHRTSTFAWPAYDEFDQVFQACNDASGLLDAAACDVYLARAKDLIATLGIACDVVGAQPAPRQPRDLATATTPWDPNDDGIYPKPWIVLAINYLAHAAAYRTNPAFAPTADQVLHAQACHESCLAWIMRYSATSPYDWGAARPLNRQTCMDFPLTQADIASAFAIPDGTGDRAYRVIAAQQPVNYGRAQGSYGAWNARIPDNFAAIDASWGNAANFNLTAPFQPAERCRELVCWAVDWKAYADFEALPSPPFDAKNAHFDSRGATMKYCWTSDNPERYTAFPNAARDARAYVGAYVWGDLDQNTFNYPAVDLGVHGADRNGNGRYDIGPVPISARMRATTIARFLMYDKRYMTGFRH